MGILMQNHKCNEVENAFAIFKVSRLVRVHTNSHHNGQFLKLIFAFFVQEVNKPIQHSVTVLKVKSYRFSNFTKFEGFSSLFV